MKKSVYSRATAFAVFALFLAGAVSAQQPPEQAAAASDPAPRPQPAAVEPAALRIGNGDLVEIAVFGVPELSSAARVSNSGEISLPLVGVVPIAGLTPEGAQRELERRFREGGYLRQPQVTVFIKEYASQGISVLGEVMNPGIFPLLGQRRLFDVISAAGGTSPRAGRVVSITRRRDPAEPIIVALSSDPMEAAKSNIPVEPGDTVVVSKAGIVYVVGDVQRPAGYVMENNGTMTVLQAVAMAGGTNRTAALGGVKLIRKTPTGPQEIAVPLKKIMSAKADDMSLQADDILFVPNSAGKSAARRGLESIIQIATGVAIIGGR